MNIALSKTRELTNIYARDMIQQVRTGALDVDMLESERKSHVRAHIYDKFEYSKMQSPAFQSYPKSLHNRIKQAAFYRALTMSRLWLKRNHALSTCIDQLQTLFRTNVETSLQFLQGKNLYGEPLKPFYEALSRDVFGKRQRMTNYFLNNHLKQVKNLLMASNDSSLIDHIKSRLTFFQERGEESDELVTSFVERVISSFKEKKKGKYVSVGESIIGAHLLNQFFKKVSYWSTRDAKTIISQRAHLHKLERKIKTEARVEQQARLQESKEKTIKIILHRETRLRRVLPELCHLTLESNQDLKVFRRKRKELCDEKKMQFLEQLDFLVQEQIVDLLHERLEKLQEVETTKELLSPIFKPSFPKIFVEKADFETFKDYHATKLDYALRSEFGSLFLSESEELFTLLSEALETIKNDLEELVKIPTARALMVQIQDSQYNYHPDYDTLTTTVNLCSRDKIQFKIIDKKRRIQELTSYDNIDTKLPTLTLKAGKILMSLPFEIKNTSSSNRPYTPLLSRNEGVSVKVDLGLKHLAVVSVQQENYNNSGKALEIARYFIGIKQVFDMVFVDGKFLPQQANFHSSDGRFLKNDVKKPSNVLSTLKGIKSEIARNQRQKEAYKKAHPDDFRTKFKYFRLRRENKLLWARVSNINSTIKDKVSQLLLQIANHHHAQYIYFEDLKWSSHGRKRSTGRYLSTMQTHWVHSQIQEQVIHRGKLEGITVKRVNAAYTSQRCSMCGLIEYKDAKGTLIYLRKGLSKEKQKERKLSRTKSRDKKVFMCQNANMHPHKRIFQIDSDLNASRNVGP